jgi:hypothetical protein
MCAPYSRTRRIFDGFVSGSASRAGARAVSAPEHYSPAELVWNNHVKHP